jgi:hypothetical protein
VQPRLRGTGGGEVQRDCATDGCQEPGSGDFKVSDFETQTGGSRHRQVGMDPPVCVSKSLTLKSPDLNPAPLREWEVVSVASL